MTKFSKITIKRLQGSSFLKKLSAARIASLLKNDLFVFAFLRIVKTLLLESNCQRLLLNSECAIILNYASVIKKNYAVTIVITNEKGCHCYGYKD